MVLQLADEGRLSLSDTLARRLPDAAKLPNAERITIAQLLAHTSGLYSANEVRAAQGMRGPYTQQEELDILARHGALFPPGACWRYRTPAIGCWAPSSPASRAGPGRTKSRRA